MQPTKTRRFTLIELLTVMAIIFVLAGLVMGVSGVVSRNMHEARTKARMEAMMTALQEHYQDRGYYPQQATAADLSFTATAFTHTQTGRPYLEGYNGGAYLDGWERPFLYATADSAGVAYPEGYHLWSKGRDKTTYPGVHTSDDPPNPANAVDDICSWKQR